MGTYLLQRKNLILVVVVVVVMVAAACPHIYRLFVSPLDTVFASSIYLPLVARSHRTTPDQRFGIAEYTPTQATLLGLGDARFIAGHWRLPQPGDTAVFLHPTERTHWSNFLLCSWSVADDDWYDEAGCRAWIRDNPGMIYIIGNELGVGMDGGGDGSFIDTTQYARWYHSAWHLIKFEDPSALVAPYGPVGQITAGLLVAVWDSHKEQFGTLLEADFYPVHHYCQPSDGADWCFTKLTHWVGWLEQHRGANWVGPRNYWPTEWGLRAWEGAIPLEASLELMEGMSPYLRNNTIGITQHAWWPSCLEWPHCTLLIHDGQITELGRKYLELALD